MTTDLDGTNIIAKGITDDFGNVTFYLQAGTYYVWRRKAHWTFSNPDAIIVLAIRRRMATTITGSTGSLMGFGGPFGSTRRVLREEVGRVFRDARRHGGRQRYRYSSR